MVMEKSYASDSVYWMSGSYPWLLFSIFIEIEEEVLASYIFGHFHGTKFRYRLTNKYGVVYIDLRTLV